MLKESFKYYKRKCPPPSLSDVIDFASVNVADSLAIKKNLGGILCREDIGLKPTKEWKVFHLNGKEGFVFICNPFTPIGQRYWIYRCLRHYTRKPNRLNLDVHGNIKGDEDWWEKCQANYEAGSVLLKKLRWATMGYHHNWDTKEYEESAHDVFPEDLTMLSQQIATTMGFNDFSAEAAIINYYNMDSTLSCHTDHSELNLEAPLLSFSFGQSAIFLLGGKTKEEKPIAMLIRSGDIVIMSGDSRLCYHGVPSIIPSTSCPWNIEDAANDKFNFESSPSETHFAASDLISSIYQECSCDKSWEPMEKYISTSRINMNVRQVLPHGQASL